MERRKFEDSFQEAFKDAEVNPSENVWTNIELDLEKAEGGKMKRRLLFFQTLAAASVVFALSVAGVGYLMLKDSNTTETIAKTGTNALPGRNLTTEEEAPHQKDIDGQDTGLAKGKVNDQLDNAAKSPVTKRDLNETSSSQQQLALGEAANSEGKATEQSRLDNQKDPTAFTPAVENESGENAVNENLAAFDRKEQTSSVTVVNKDNKSIANTLPDEKSQTTLTQKNNLVGVKPERPLPAFYEPKQPELQLPVSTADPGMLLLAKLDAEEKKYAKEEKRQQNKSEKLWTSVGFAAGAFNANNPSISPVPSNSYYSLNVANTASKQSKASGSAYSVGVSIGTKLSERWVLQGGVNYLTQSSDYTANNVVVMGGNFDAPKAESLNAFNSQLADASAQTRVAQTYPYNVNNSVRFVSVPLQAGYLILNKKFGVQLNAGVSTDLFLQNTITPDGGGLSKTTQGRGDDSPYRSLNFSGLMGTELSYKLGYRYRVSVNPGLRYPFSSVYKSATGVDATPLTFDVGLRFRYIFH
ncbi:hypothetical protein [Chryseolinea sp. H1M3-3]|uniref:hypothetical protein n=1 Tax=Chryseolinea sp. H1M3-3 TaxID=3034144 RepID=UPI0023ED2A3E|nr:hypothetical protein [Chryseolinea sp. H1M3-3]